MGQGKKVLEPKKIITAGDMSADVTSSVVEIKGINDLAVQLIFTGSPTGTFYIQSSVDYGINGASATWAAVTTSPATISASGSGSNHLISLEGYSFPWVRVFYDFSSGTGSLDAYISGKES